MNSIDADKSSDQHIHSEKESLKLNIKSLELPVAPSDIRLCFDFGTAMSKVTLVKDGDEDLEVLDDITVLKLGIPGDQEQISENMLVSSVYIDDAGLLWFGHKAVDMSRQDNNDGLHQRLDSIKRFLSEDGLHAEIGAGYKRTEVKVTYYDITLANLMFLTWCVNVCTEKEGHPVNIKRRFAMPCYEGGASDVSSKVENLLKNLLGEAQVLADTFCTMFHASEGIPLQLYLEKVKELKREHREYKFIAESITEPVGVANTLLTQSKPTTEPVGVENTLLTKRKPKPLALVIDVGAGTTDMALFYFWRHEEAKINRAMQIKGSSRTLTEAGDYLDGLLMEFILNKADIGHEHPKNMILRSAIALKIREYKETLFVNYEVDIYVPEYDFNVTINLDDFLKIKQIENFSHSLQSAMRDILENVDQSHIGAIMSFGGLAVVLTGGGAGLPMIRELAPGTLDIHGKEVSLKKRSARFPPWLENYPDIQQDYSRIAVSLGGARKELIQVMDKASTVTAIAALPPKMPQKFV